MSETQIQIGQTWARKRDGAEFRVVKVESNYVGISRLGENVFPWTSQFLKAYELVTPVQQNGLDG
jgi:hypothetical protein